MRARRTVYVLFHAHDVPFLDIEAMLRGVVQSTTTQRLNAISILRGENVEIDRADIDAALAFPSTEWTDVDPAREAEVEALARKALVVVDGTADPALAALRQRDEQLSANQWNLYAAAYHFLTRWRDVDLRRLGASPSAELIEELPPVTAEAIEQFIELHGQPPEPFHELAAPRDVTTLPVSDRDGGLYDALARRKTTRGYDRDATVSLDDVSTVLRYVVGAHGWAPIVGSLYSIKRTSPSGGGLHPVEAYPLINGVEGVEPGLYHYRARDHALELVAPLAAADATELATQLVCGQSYFGSAHVSVILTARYYRSFWKYRKHQKAYSALLMDAAHLSQTLYLLAAELGLGSYVTVAINSALIDDTLDLDPASEGALAVCGFGKPSPQRSSFEPTFRPYRPRETQPPA